MYYSKENQSYLLPNPPSLVEYKTLRFLIMDAPSTRNLDLYIQEMKKKNVTDLVRVCEPTYEKADVEKNNIRVHDWPFDDGDPPPTVIVKQWLDLVNKVFKLKGYKENKKKKGSKNDSNTGSGNSYNSSQGSSNSEKQISENGTENYESPCIAIHCVAGLGRAPVLVALALIQAGMTPLDSISYIRERRHGAINHKQLTYIEAYGQKHINKSCIIQ